MGIVKFTVASVSPVDGGTVAPFRYRQSIYAPSGSSLAYNASQSEPEPGPFVTDVETVEPTATVTVSGGT